MFGNSKPLAALTSGLLARKGQARPAMRPQGFALPDLANAGDELGWNDMGEAPAIPPVLAEREALKEEIEAVPPAPAADSAPVVDDAPAEVSLATARRLQRETRHKSKAAFTLRLDQDRHLKLRLAAATRHRSAQALVTEALDAFLVTLPEVEALVAQLPAHPKR